MLCLPNRQSVFLSKVIPKAHRSIQPKEQPLPGSPVEQPRGSRVMRMGEDIFSVAWWHQSTRWLLHLPRVALSWVHLCQPQGLLPAAGAWLFSFHWKCFTLTFWCFSNPSGTVSTCNFFPKELNLVTFFFLQASGETERYLTYVLFIAVTISC